MQCISREQIKNLVLSERGTITVSMCTNAYCPMYVAYYTDPITGEIAYRTKPLLRKTFVKWLRTIPATQVLTIVQNLTGISTSAYFINESNIVYSKHGLQFQYREKFRELNKDEKAFEQWLLTEKHFKYYFV